MLDDALDAIVGVKTTYIRKRREALDQMELNAAQGNTAEVSQYSSEAERHGAAIAALNEALNAVEDALSEDDSHAG